jgi:hypothetical protein
MATTLHPPTAARSVRAVGLLLLLCAVGGPAVGQEAPAVLPQTTGMPVRAGTAEQTLQAGHLGLLSNSGCSDCGGGSGGGYGSAGCGSGGCGEGNCGRDCVVAEGAPTRIGRFLQGVHNALCCPDPCYVPRWNCPANAALFVDHARPTTMTRLRWDAGRNLTDPDRAEYFWAQTGGPGPANPETRVDYHELHLYQEIGTEKFSLFIDLPYRSFDSDRNGGHGGIGDLKIGTKSVLLDSDLLLCTFQFVTSVPTAGPGGGIGTGHVSLDPSLLTTVKLDNCTYWQSQTGYWFGVGNSNGSVLHYANSLNRVLWTPLPDTRFVGTFETVGYTFTSGSFTDPAGVVRAANGTTYFSVGPGFRLCMCDRLDLGFGMQFAVTDRHFAQRLYRTELRWRF